MGTNGEQCKKGILAPPPVNVGVGIFRLSILPTILRIFQYIYLISCAKIESFADIWLMRNEKYLIFEHFYTFSHSP